MTLRKLFDPLKSRELLIAIGALILMEGVAYSGNPHIGNSILYWHHLPEMVSMFFCGVWASRVEVSWEASSGTLLSDRVRMFDIHNWIQSSTIRFVAGVAILVGVLLANSQKQKVSHTGYQGGMNVNKVLMLLALLLGFGLGNFILNPHTPLLQRGWAICSVLIDAAVLSYCDDLLRKWKIEQ